MPSLSAPGSPKPDTTCSLAEVAASWLRLAEPFCACHRGPAWLEARAWVFAPIASELPDDWAAVPRAGSCVALAWQGILRELEPGTQVRPKVPGPSPILSRADIVALSRHDVPAGLPLHDIGQWVAPECDVLLTAGLLGGMLLRFRGGRLSGARAYASVASDLEIDATGAGDTMLAGLVAARLAAGDEARTRGRDLHVGAAASSLLVEGPGMESVPTLDQLATRMRRPKQDLAPGE